jgi:putative ATP-binding cassette transporter
MFMPKHAYVAPGALRASVTYPNSAQANADEEAIRQALEKVGLGRFAAQLDEVQRWDRRLSGDEKQCLAFARVLLQEPSWIVLDEVLDELDARSRARIEALLRAELSEVGVISISDAAVEPGVFTRRLRIVTDPAGPAFRPSTRFSSGARTWAAYETVSQAE